MENKHKTMNNNINSGVHGISSNMDSGRNELYQYTNRINISISDLKNDNKITNNKLDNITNNMMTNQAIKDINNNINAIAEDSKQTLNQLMASINKAEQTISAEIAELKKQKEELTTKYNKDIEQLKINLNILLKNDDSSDSNEFSYSSDDGTE